MHLLMKKHNIAYGITKEIEPESGPLNPAANLQEIQRRKNHVELPHEYTILKKFRLWKILQFKFIQ